MSKSIKDSDSILRFIYENLVLIGGCLIMALGFNLFLVPNQIASGGVTGLSVILNYLFGLEPAYIQLAINIPMLVIGIILIGKKFGVKSAIGTVALPLLILLTKSLHPMTQNLLMAAGYGGIVSGFGLGLTFLYNGSIGGSSILALILEKYFGVRIGTAVMIIDGLVILLAGFVFTPEKALYSLIVVFLTSKTVDFVQMGFNSSKVAFVISDKVDEIEDGILHELSRGVTKLQGNGAYTVKDKTILMVVMSDNEITKFKKLIKNLDRKAFVIISNTHEVLGKGFKLPS